MGKTSIEWTKGDDGSAGETWNPVTGCTKVSPGCDHCYAETLTERFHGKGSFAEVKLHHDRLDAPRRWRKPRRVFVNSMSDLFHDAVPSAFIAAVFDVMRETPQHTYQILTKRHARMRSLMKTAVPGEGWPLPNVWLGVSVEDEKRADLRIPALLDTPAAVRFISAEPLLGPVSLRSGWWDNDYRDYLDWVIIGGESGPGARPLDIKWVTDLMADAHTINADVFVKQLGSVWARDNGAKDRKGGDPSEWPEDLQIREFPMAVTT